MTFDPNTIISAGVSLIGVIAGGVLSAWATTNKRRYERVLVERDDARRYLAAACDQITGYHAVEGVYADELATGGHGAKRAIKIRFRDRAVTTGAPRPTWTGFMAEKVKQAHTGDGVKLGNLLKK